MKAWIVTMAALLACVPFSVRADEAAPIMTSVVWDISLDANGRVMRLATDDTKVPRAHAQLEEAIRSWKFSPGKLDGRPVATNTHLVVRLAITRVEGHYELEVVRASTGAYYGKTVPPKYPESAVKMRKEGVALVYATFDGTGKVTGAVPARDVAEPDRRLMKAAIKSIGGWTFVPEVVGGRPIAGAALVPVCFRLHGSTHDCSWKRADAGALNDGDELVALDPAATLETDVAGRTL